MWHPKQSGVLLVRGLVAEISASMQEPSTVYLYSLQGQEVNTFFSLAGMTCRTPLKWGTRLVGEDCAQLWARAVKVGFGSTGRHVQFAANLVEA